MPTAANLSGAKVAGAEAAPVAAPGVSEMFAALVAAVGPVPQEGTAATEEEAEAVVAPDQRDSDGAVDAAILLPMLDQQRAALPAQEVLTVPSVGATRNGSPEQPATEVGRLEPGSPQFAAARVEFQQMQAGIAQREVSAEQKRQAYVTDMDAKGIYVPDSYRKARTDGTAFALENELKEWGEKGNWTIMARHNYGDAVKGMSADQIRGYVQSGEADRVVAAYNARTGPGAGAFAPAALSRTGVSGELRAVASSGGAAKIGTVAAAAPQGQIGQLLPQAVGSLAVPASAPVKAAARPAAIQGADVAGLPIGTVATQELTARPANAAPAPVPAGLPVEVRQEPVVLDQLGAMQLLKESAATAPTAATPVSGPLTSAPAGPAQNLGAAIAAQVLDLAKGGEWIDEVARDIARSASSEGAMRFRLTPETLGELRVEITQTDRGAHVRLVVTSEAAQQALAEAQPKLVQEARAQGVRIAEAEVSLTDGQSQSRDPSRQAPSDQPMRSFRSAPDENFSSSGERSAATRPGRTDLYA